MVMQKDNHGIRIAFGTRDNENKTRPGYVDITIDDDHRINISLVSKEYLLELGNPGLFDDSGIWLSSVEFSRNLKRHLFYYIGWHRGVTVPYYMFAGLAIGDPSAPYLEKYMKAPILPRSKVDPYGTSSPWIFKEREDFWRLYYVSIVNYGEYEGKNTYFYHIRYAESEDGINWDRKGIVAIDFKYPGETRIARPVVIKEDGMYKMWYCYAIGHGGYRIGYAESEDGVNWVRKDNELRFIGERGEWEREMMAYPYVFEHHGRKYMLYNGNGYGRTGFGLAVLEE